MGTHSVDPRELLRELEHDGDEDGLSVAGGSEEFHHSDFFFLCHPYTLIFHLLDVLSHILGAPQSLENWWKAWRGKVNGKALSRILFPHETDGKKPPRWALHLAAQPASGFNSPSHPILQGLQVSDLSIIRQGKMTKTRSNVLILKQTKSLRFLQWRCEGYSLSLALSSSFLLMSKNLGLSGQNGRAAHWRMAGMMVKPKSSGQSSLVPKMFFRPKI